MKIVFLCISYSENVSINFYEELLQEFISHGHDIFVVAAVEKRTGKDTRVSEERGIHVLRVKTGNITENPNLIDKGISTILIDKQYQNAINKYWGDEKFDLILYPTPPITLAGTVEYLKKKNKASTYLLLKDIFPQNAVDLGMLKVTGIKGLIYKWFRNKEKNLYKISDYIGCMSPANVKYVLNHNEFVKPDKIEVCPNCIKILNDIYATNERTEIRRKYQIPIDKKVFVYGGNLGRPQGIDFFLACLEATKDIDDAYFLVAGGGTEAEKIKNYITEYNISNAKILGSLPKEDYELLVEACDIGLVFLDYRFTIPNFPSRILSYMQKSKPVLICSDPNTDMGLIAEKNGFGWRCLSNDTKAFAECIKKILLTFNLNEMGANGRKYLEENYNVKNGYEIIMKHFDDKN